MLLVTCRPEFGNPWRNYANVTSFALNRLDRRQSMALVAGASGQSLPKALIAAVIARADGIPLFIEELTKSIVESGLSAESGASATPAIPTTLQGSLLARLDRLGGTHDAPFTASGAIPPQPSAPARPPGFGTRHPPSRPWSQRTTATSAT
jgi:predicted ATPase